MNMWHLESF